MASEPGHRRIITFCSGQVAGKIDFGRALRSTLRDSMAHREPRTWDLKRINAIFFSVAIPLLCLPSAFLGVRELLPVRMQTDFFDFMARHPVAASFVTYLFYVVAVLGIQMCAVATGMFAILLFLKGVPKWLKAAMAVLILLAVCGIIAVRHAVGR
jgi:predicted membrane channel-forming protein YqfA (hemolysin III family)